MCLAPEHKHALIHFQQKRALSSRKTQCSSQGTGIRKELPEMTVLAVRTCAMAPLLSVLETQGRGGFAVKIWWMWEEGGAGCIPHPAWSHLTYQREKCWKTHRIGGIYIPCWPLITVRLSQWLLPWEPDRSKQLFECSFRGPGLVKPGRGFALTSGVLKLPGCFLPIGVFSMSLSIKPPNIWDKMANHMNLIFVGFWLFWKEWHHRPPRPEEGRVCNFYVRAHWRLHHLVRSPRPSLICSLFFFLTVLVQNNSSW